MAGLEGLTWDDWADWHSAAEVQEIARAALELLQREGTPIDDKPAARAQEPEDDALDRMERVDRCVFCGAVIPEGGHVCPRCMAGEMEAVRDV